MTKTSDLDKSIGNKIRECRLEAGYSQTILADLLEFESPTAISLIESGERSLKIKDLIILCQLFMKDYKYFLGKPKDYNPIKKKK